MRVLLVEDEPRIAVEARERLERDGCEVVVERTGEGGYFRGLTESFDAILLDLTLPGRDGFQIRTALRQEGVTTPILLMAAGSGAEADRLAHGGADEYVIKPVAAGDVLARVRVQPGLDS